MKSLARRDKKTVKVVRFVASVALFPFALVVAMIWTLRQSLTHRKDWTPNTTPCGVLCRYSRESSQAYIYLCTANAMALCPMARTAFRDPKNPNNCTMFEKAP